MYKNKKEKRFDTSKNVEERLGDRRTLAYKKNRKL